MKLITELQTNVQLISEAVDGQKKNLFIEGIYMQAEIKNKNGRVYPKSILKKEVDRYIKENVELRRNAYGELGHPSGPTINPDKISHLIVSLREDGNDYVGRAKILDTPMGNIARSLLEGGGGIAVSSRGIGSLRQNGDRMQVCEDFMLATAGDIVINPSAPDAFVDGILEHKEYFWENSLLKERDLEQARKDLDRARLTEQQILNAFYRLISSVQ